MNKVLGFTVVIWQVSTGVYNPSVVHNYFPQVLVLQVLLFIVMGNKSLVLWCSFVFPSLVLVLYFTSNIAFVLSFL